MRYECANCGKLTIPAVTIGGLVYGPTCSRNLQLVKPTGKRAKTMRDGVRVAVVTDTKTLDLFGADNGR